MQTEEEIRRIRTAVDLQGAMPAVQEQIDAMKRTVEVNVFQAIRKGELTPERAMAYWMEVYAINRLNTRLHEMTAPAEQVTTRKEVTYNG